MLAQGFWVFGSSFGNVGLGNATAKLYIVYCSSASLILAQSRGLLTCPCCHSGLDLLSLDFSFVLGITSTIMGPSPQFFFFVLTSPYDYTNYMTMAMLEIQ